MGHDKTLLPNQQWIKNRLFVLVILEYLAKTVSVHRSSPLSFFFSRGSGGLGSGKIIGRHITSRQRQKYQSDALYQH